MTFRDALRNDLRLLGCPEGCLLVFGEEMA